MECNDGIMASATKLAYSTPKPANLRQENGLTVGDDDVRGEVKLLCGTATVNIKETTNLKECPKGRKGRWTVTESWTEQWYSHAGVGINCRSLARQGFTRWFPKCFYKIAVCLEITPIFRGIDRCSGVPFTRASDGRLCHSGHLVNKRRTVLLWCCLLDQSWINLRRWKIQRRLHSTRGWTSFCEKSYLYQNGTLRPRSPGLRSRGVCCT